MRRLVCLAVSLLVPSVAPASPAGEPIKPALLSAPPVIDGVLDDAAWQSATVVTGFKTWRPDFSKEPAGQTTVYAAYDAENMYFAFRAADPEPARIKASMASRDSIRPDDWVCINLDSFNDKQTLYSFYVNPLGIQMDSRSTANKEDMGFDAVWYSAGRIDGQGYSVEIRIPFRSIRYSARNPVAMGVVFERSVSRSSEGSTSPPLDPAAGSNFNIQTQAMLFSDIRHYRLFEVLPDVTYTRQDESRAGSLARTASTGDFGATGRYAITPQLTVDAAFNPDFSQVEADAGQIDVNLRHSLFFAEKRPFFLEGNEVFAIGGPTQNGVLQSVLHTRTIVNPRLGLKVSGKVAPRDTVSALYAADETGRSADGGRDYAHFSVMRYRRALNEDAYLGAFYVGREQGASHNRIGGVDGLVRLSPSSALGFHAFESGTDWGTSGPASTTGHAVGADFTRDTRRFVTYLAAYDVSSGFSADAGYLTRSGIGTLLGTETIRFYPSSRAVRRVDLTVSTQQTHDAPSGIWETSNDANVSITLAGAGLAQLGCRLATEVYLGREFDTNGCTVAASKQFSKEWRAQVTASRSDAIYYAADPYGGMATRASATLVYQPSDKWAETLTLTYANFDRRGGVGRVYDYGILRSKTTFQTNRYLFFRGILEYNDYRRQLLTDLLASFTYIPGTVVHAGYGSLFERSQWDGTSLVRSSSFLELRRGFFFKASYLWRL